MVACSPNMAENLDSGAPSVSQRRVEIVSAMEKGQEMSKNDPVSLSETGNFSCSDSIQETTKINLLFDSERAQSRAFSAVEEKIQEVEKAAGTEVERIFGAPNGFEMTEKTKETVEEEKETAELEPRLVLEAHTEDKKTTQIKECKEISGSLENNKPESKEVMGSFEINKTENILEEKANCVSEAHFSDLSNSSNVSEEALNSSSDVSEMGKMQENKCIQNIDPTSVPNFGKGTFYKNAKSEMVKCSRRKGKANKNGLEVNGKQNGSSLLAGVVVSESMGEGSKRMYSRRDMEALRFVNVSEQKEMWNEIYKVLVSVLGQKLDQIAYFKNQKRGTMNDDRRVRLGRKNDAAPILGEAFFQNLEATPEKGGSSVARDDYLDGVDGIAVVDEISEADEDSDSEYDSIQRPAFYVEGEPDFDSGPPQDGLEYLRRVRWEAAQCPKIKVAKIGTSKLCCEQTPYMPNIPEIARCQEHLLPSKQWEDTFLEDFSQMRLGLTVLENSIVENSHFPLPVISMEEDLKEVAAGNLSKTTKSVPMLSAILGMDIVSRASMLRSRIRSLETESTLSRENCLWIYALCVAVDTPFDSDMSASMRSLLRKCASLRAEKLEFDDELAMLNMLVTIAGRYFGQLESQKCWARES